MKCVSGVKDRRWCRPENGLRREINHFCNWLKHEENPTEIDGTRINDRPMPTSPGVKDRLRRGYAEAMPRLCYSIYMR